MSAITTYHVYPPDDQITHEISEHCICGPRQEILGEDGVYEVYYIHHCLDGREMTKFPDLHDKDYDD